MNGKYWYGGSQEGVVMVTLCSRSSPLFHYPCHWCCIIRSHHLKKFTASNTQNLSKHSKAVRWVLDYGRPLSVVCVRVKTHCQHGTEKLIFAKFSISFNICLRSECRERQGGLTLLLTSERVPLFGLSAMRTISRAGSFEKRTARKFPSYIKFLLLFTHSDKKVISFHTKHQDSCQNEKTQA